MLKAAALLHVLYEKLGSYLVARVTGKMQSFKKIRFWTTIGGGLAGLVQLKTLLETEKNMNSQKTEKHWFFFKQHFDRVVLFEFKAKNEVGGL